VPGQRGELGAPSQRDGATGGGRVCGVVEAVQHERVAGGAAVVQPADQRAGAQRAVRAARAHQQRQRDAAPVQFGGQVRRTRQVVGEAGQGHHQLGHADNQRRSA
jgi:hypothetical protein